MPDTQSKLDKLFGVVLLIAMVAWLAMFIVRQPVEMLFMAVLMFLFFGNWPRGPRRREFSVSRGKLFLTLPNPRP